MKFYPGDILESRSRFDTYPTLKVVSVRKNKVRVKVCLFKLDKMKYRQWRKNIYRQFRITRLDSYVVVNGDGLSRARRIAKRGAYK